MAKSRQHELTFCTEVAKWMDEELARRPELSFGRAFTEESLEGSGRKRDLTLYDRTTQKVLLTGEVKLPYQVDGQSPYNHDVVGNAYVKAGEVGAKYFFTWNVNRFVLWRTDEEGKPLHDRHLWDYRLANQVHRPEDLKNPQVIDALKKAIALILERASLAVTDQLPLEKRPLDEFFLQVLEAALDRPISLTLQALYHHRSQRPSFKKDLEGWMRDVQGWTLSDDELLQRRNLENAAKFSCYVLVNKIAFYNALRKRYSRQLPVLRFESNDPPTAEEFMEALTGYFAKAKKATRDYETVFDGDFGDSLPFLADEIIPAWIDLLSDLDQFDFAKINYDVIGPIFERLISPEERHRYGQHYTKPDIVDLINAFCIRSANAAVMDPACGGGTFLVRAYNRRKTLALREQRPLTHQDQINSLYGVDISSYAVHLATLNLATRDLIDDCNYPLVAREDFFKVECGKPLYHVPLGKGGVSGQVNLIDIPQVQAIVGNPPYVRQEDIASPAATSLKRRANVSAASMQRIKEGADEYKRHLSALVQREWPGYHWSGRSDLHIFFWPHATSFLAEGGYLGLLTQSGWLDVDYGFALQHFLLEHYAIQAVLESAQEPWFTDARVTTCATILRKEPDPEKRANQLVRFVQLRSPLSTVLPGNVSEDVRQAAVDALRQRLESITQNCLEPHWRVRVIRQADLKAQGLVDGTGRYRGSKWGIQLRAPDIFFTLLDRYGSLLVPLRNLAEVRFGVKSGCDKFFFPRDQTERCLQEYSHEDFKNRFGISKSQTAKVRIVKAGDDSLHLIEERFLQPEVHNLKDLIKVTVAVDNCKKAVLICSSPKDELQGTYVRKYIEWGESEGFHDGSTCASRAKSRPWYDLAPRKAGDMFWPMAQQYRHVVALNPHRLICNHNLFDIFSRQGVSKDILCAILNSTVVALSKHQYGRWAGQEGNLKTEVIDVNMMLVPDPRQASRQVLQRIKKAFRAMQGRLTRKLIEEFELSDRQELDDAVLELLGENDPQTRLRLREQLYAQMTEMHSAIRAKEVQANENKKRSKSKRVVSPKGIADEILTNLGPEWRRFFPDNFLSPSWPVDTVNIPEGKARLRENPMFGVQGVQVGTTLIEADNRSRAEFMLELCQRGLRGAQVVPTNADHCKEALVNYGTYREGLLEHLDNMVNEKTSDTKLQQRILKLLRAKCAV